MMEINTLLCCGEITEEKAAERARSVIAAVSRTITLF